MSGTNWDGVKSALRLAAGALAATGIVLLGLMRLGQDAYYSSLGSSVNEVGVSLPETIGAGVLASTLLGVLVLLGAASLAALTALTAPMFRATGRYARRMMLKDVDESAFDDPVVAYALTATRIALAVLPFLAAWFVGFILLIGLGNQAAADVRQGREPRISARSALGVSGHCVRVADAEPDASDPRWPQLQTAMLIGANASHLLLIGDGGRGQLWRVPAAQVIVVSAGQPDGACQ